MQMSRGSFFWKADLHIHSYGTMGSYDVTDQANTPEAIVDTAITKGLKIISITDHNQILNSIRAVQYSVGKEILVIPGIEVSTTQGHLLVYFETIQQLQSFYGRLSFTDDMKSCFQGIIECLNYANGFNGFGILAHISENAGFEKTIGRFGPQMENIFRCKNLLGLEITNKEESSLYTDNDTDNNHRKLLNIWRDTNDDRINRNFAKVMSSDSHTLEKLGKNAQGENRLTRIKMHEMSFRSFRLALLSSESRVRIEVQVPDKRPIIDRIKIEGGLLDKTEIELSPNLTCIIGSRGAGKSTLLESIRAGSGNPSGSKLCDSEVWPQSIRIDYVNDIGLLSTLLREKNGYVINLTDQTNGLTKVPIESYGQGDTASTLQHSEENPQVLIDFLDSFLSLDHEKNIDETLINQLRENRSEIQKLRINIASLPEAQKALANEERKMKVLQESKAAELVTFHNGLIAEREFRNTLTTQLKELVSKYSNALSDNSVFEMVANMTDEKVIIGKDYFSEVKILVNDIATFVANKSSELNRTLEEQITKINTQLSSWQNKESEIQQKIERKKVELRNQGVPFDMGQINQVSKDILTYKRKVDGLKKDNIKLLELLKERDKLIEIRVENKKEIYRKHYEFSTHTTTSLKNTINDFFIKVKYKEGVYSPDFESTLKTLMGWRTSQVPKAKIIAQNINIYDFCRAIRSSDRNALRAIKHEEQQLLTESEIDSIISNLQKDYLYEELESLTYDDYPEIIVSKLISTSEGKKPVIRHISQLSLGQQQSVLLGILLSSNSNKPLLIDQPEDNLDSEFIFKSIVSNLRKIKEYRQVIIVTHNPNIAVLGDAELVIPLKSTSTHSQIMCEGSIDNESTVDMCCQILEGGNAAFKQRKTIYGF